MWMRILLTKKTIYYNILSNNLLHVPEEPFAMIFTGGGGTGNITMIKAMCARVNDIYLSTNSV